MPRRAGKSSGPPFKSTVFRPATTANAYGISIDASGRIVDVLEQNGAPVSDQVRRCYLEALSGQTFPCLSGDEFWYECVVTLR